MQKETLEILTDYVTIIGLPLTLTGIITGIVQIRYSKKVDEARLWIELREVFRNHNAVHLNLRNGGAWAHSGKGPATQEEWANVDAYLGQFELCQMMIENKLINKKIFRSQYSYRIHNILQNKTIKEKIKNQKRHWELFISLCLGLGYEI